MKLTLDVNLLKLEPKPPGMETLQQWEKEGKVELLAVDRPKERTGPVIGWPGATSSSEPPQKPSWRISRARSKKTEGGNASFKNIAAILFPRKDSQKLSIGEVNDVAHLVQHVMSKNEIFVTGNEKGFIENGRRELLRASCGIIAMTPAEAVKMLEELHGWKSESRQIARKTVRVSK